MRRSLGQLLRFGVVGVATNVLGYSLYLLITYLGGTPKVTMSVLYVVFAALGFWGNRILTFGYAGNLRKARLRYALAYAAGYLINFVILVVLVDTLGFSHQLSQALSIVVVAAFLFAALKLCVFREGAGPVAPAQTHPAESTRK